MFYRGWSPDSIRDAERLKCALSKFGKRPWEITRTHLVHTKIEQRQERVLDFLQPFCIKAKWRKETFEIEMLPSHAFAKHAYCTNKFNKKTGHFRSRFLEN